MVEITGINIATGGEGEVDHGSIFLSFQVNIGHFGGLLQNILWRVVVDLQIQTFTDEGLYSCSFEYYSLHICRLNMLKMWIPYFYPCPAIGKSSSLTQTVPDIQYRN